MEISMQGMRTGGCMRAECKFGATASRRAMMVTPRLWATAPAAPSYPALVQAPNRIFHFSIPGCISKYFLPALAGSNYVLIPTVAEHDMVR